MLRIYQYNYGTGTYTLKENILQQLVTIQEEVLNKILLSIHKAYDTIYWEPCLKIL